MLLEKDIKQILHTIKELREQKGLIHEYMAEKLNITRQGYGKIEKGITALSLERFLKICQVLEVSPLQILYGIDADEVALEKFNSLFAQLQILVKQYENPTPKPRK